LSDETAAGTSSISSSLFSSHGFLGSARRSAVSASCFFRPKRYPFFSRNALSSPASLPPPSAAEPKPRSILVFFIEAAAQSRPPPISPLPVEFARFLLLSTLNLDRRNSASFLFTRVSGWIALVYEAPSPFSQVCFGYPFAFFPSRIAFPLPAEGRGARVAAPVPLSSLSV